jgi:hypothetical protein
MRRPNPRLLLALRGFSDRILVTRTSRQAIVQKSIEKGSSEVTPKRASDMTHRLDKIHISSWNASGC